VVNWGRGGRRGHVGERQRERRPAAAVIGERAPTPGGGEAPPLDAWRGG
jgi:hypothetical protein